MRQAPAKETGSVNAFINKALSTNDDIYVFVNPMHRVVVLFKYPEYRVLEKLIGLCECNVIDSTEVEDHIWDNYVLQSSIAEDEPLKLDGTKSSLTNVIALTGYLKSIDDILNIYNRSQMAISEVVASSLMELNKSMTEEKVLKMDLPQLLVGLSTQLNFRDKNLKGFVDGLTGGNKEQQQQQKQQQVQPEELTLKDVVAPPNQEVLEATTFTRVEDVNQARQSKAFRDVFQKLDYISKKGLTQDEIDEKINPTKDLGGGVSMVGGKIIDENAPKKKIDKKKIRSRRVIG